MARLYRFVIVVALGGLALLAVVQPARADTDGTYNYTIANGSATVGYYLGAGGAVIIPSTLGGVPVTSIGDLAFRNCTSLTSVTIPDGVVSIGYLAFSNCTSLTSATIPSSVTSFGGGVFSGCASLTSITIPSGATRISSGMFQDCTSLTTFTIPDGVTSIGLNAFAGCTSLTTVTIPGSVTSIEDNAFYGCSLTGAFFEGDAPSTVGSGVFWGPGFRVFCREGQAGFPPPPGPWRGYETAFWGSVPTAYTLTYGSPVSGANPQTVAHGLSGTPVTAVPWAGYYFLRWSDNVWTATRTDYNVTANKSVFPLFSRYTYTLSYTAGQGGTISGMTPQTVAHGLSGTPVTAVPWAGYHFVKWSDGVMTAGRTDINVTADKTVQAIFAPPPLIPIAGASRFDTAVEASKWAYPVDGSVKTVVIATGRNWPDALGGSALAGALDGPILLVDTNVVPDVVLEEIQRLGATRAIIVGGEAAVSADVATALQKAGLSVEREAGGSRYQTADAIALRVIEELGVAYDGTAFVATGGGYADAVAAGPLAASQGWPLFLAHPTTGISPATLIAMADVTDVLVLGGTGAVSTGVEDELEASFNVTRLAGSTRYATAVEIATHGVDHTDLGWDRVGIATGQSYPDALAGGVLQGKVGSVMLLTSGTVISPEPAAVLAANKNVISTVTFFGGSGAVSQTVRDAVAQALR